MNRYAPLWHNAGFRAIWSAAIISGLGDRIAAIALYLLIYRLTGNPLDLGLLAATQILPAIVLGPIAGLACDRLSRRRIMITSDVVSALVVASIPLAATPAHVYLLATALGCSRQFNGPARMSLLPDVVGQDLVGGANSLLMLTRNIVLLVGPAVGGALVAWRGTAPAFWLDAITFVASAAVLFAWRYAEPGRALVAAAAADGSATTIAAPTADAAGPISPTLRVRVRTLWADTIAGLTGLGAHAGLRLAFGFFALLTFVTAMQQPLVVVFVKDILAGSDRQLGFIIAAAGLGGIVGALAGGVAAAGSRPLRTIALLTGLDGVLLLAFAFNRSVPGALVLFVGFGALATLAQIALVTYLQQVAPEESRGRTFGWLGTVVGPLSLAAVFLGPLLAEFAGVVLVLAGCGVAELVLAGIVIGRGRIGNPRPAVAQIARNAESETA